MAENRNQGSEAAGAETESASWQVRWIVLLLVLLIASGAGLYVLLGSGESSIVQDEETQTVSAAETAPETTPVDLEPPEGVEVPEGMVYVPGGRTLVGNDTKESGNTFRHRSNAQPTFWAEVDPFFMDAHPVTVAQFRAFVEETGFETQAEEFGNAGILDPRRRQWRLIDGATWRRPFGPDGPKAPDNHPVTQVSWNDAVAYCEWSGKRLPTEVEWEHAARGARNSRDAYAWGDTLVDDGRFRANTWQGRFPNFNQVRDGYQYTSPVGAFGKTPLGLTDMGGNVWEWTSSWYRPYDQRDEPFTPTKQSQKVQRGGSFQCNECLGYRVYTRSYSTPETSLFHVGFRCAKDAPAADAAGNATG